ncbi:MAG: 30S ribosomal protein S21 [Candidatus Pacebacteria bacterium]|nr:30S ribosomal protein S21 [Candidatus Paceibacterota bacterium]
MHINKKEGETTGSLLYRFSKKMQQSGILREARKRRFHNRPISRLKRKLSAIHRDAKKKELAKNKKMGLA